MSTALPWSTAWRIARRDLSARFKGLRLLLACLFLGVGAIAAIGTLTGAIQQELDTRGQVILGGDVEIRVWQRDLTDEEHRATAQLGILSAGTRMQAIALRNELSAPISLKAVDDNWPLFGEFSLQDGRKASAPPQGTAWVAEGAAERLGMKPGDRFTIGGQDLTVGGIIADEPDRLGEGFALGAPVIVRDDFPGLAALTAPGAMFQTKKRIALKPGLDPDVVVEQLEDRFPDAGLEYRTRDKAAPGAERFVSRMGEFLVLVGLAALVIAGIGIGGGVTSYLDARRNSIATLKVLGASSGDIARIYVLQIAAAALVGSLAGLAVGVAITPLLGKALEGLLPVSPGFVFDIPALVRAITYGLLVALIFAAPPLLRARAFPAMALMRARVSPLALTGRSLLVVVGGGTATILALALATAERPEITALFMAGAAGVLALLALVGLAIRKLAAKVPRPRDPLLRAGLANLHRPSSQTGALVTALGFGLSAFVLLAALETSLSANIAARIPQRAPDYFVLDIPRDREAEFRNSVTALVPNAEIRTIPNLRGRVLAYGPENSMIRVSNLEELPDGAWPLRGDRGITYAEELPEGSVITAGEWWPKDYSGEPLVSVSDELAQAIDLKIGDKLTIGLLGIERTMRIASFRRIEWDNMGFNHSFVFSPNALQDVPHSLAATIEIPNGAARDGLLRSLVRSFPSSSVIETGMLLRDARTLLGQMSTAILAAASVAIFAGLAVLTGAIEAARMSRTYDNVIFRVLGASRKQLWLLQLAEYGLLCAVLAIVALAFGSAIGWAIMTQMFEFDWLPHWPTVLAVLGAGVLLTLGLALAGSIPLLRAKPPSALREL